MLSWNRPIDKDHQECCLLQAKHDVLLFRQRRAEPIRAEVEWADGQTENMIGCGVRWVNKQVLYGVRDNNQKVLWSSLSPRGTRILCLTCASTPRPQLCPHLCTSYPQPHLRSHSPLYLTFIPHHCLWNTPLKLHFISQSVSLTKIYLVLDALRSVVKTKYLLLFLCSIIVITIECLRFFIYYLYVCL